MKLWRCKHCDSLPDIQFLGGKNFRIVCCRGKITGATIDEVVNEWNGGNCPIKWRARFSDWWADRKESSVYLFNLQKNSWVAFIQRVKDGFREPPNR